MADWAIVAIASEQDPVWKFASDVPHLTLLYLGNQTGNENEQRIADFLEHASTTLYRFGLSVDHRGLLGDKDADVLFFNKNYCTPKVNDFRSVLLQDNDIRDAYNTAMQYPEWTPHLTLGMPDNPAKEDDRDYPGFSWVNFDKIALWTGDSTGPEFLLKEQALAMEQVEKAEEFLAHYGILGMKWGRRKDDGNPSFKQLRANDKAERAKDKVTAQNKVHQNDIDILNARKNLVSERGKLKTAKTQYKVDKYKIGKVRAQKFLQTQRVAYNQTFAKAMENTQREAANQFLTDLFIGGLPYASIRH